jgi:hypothetical protein
MIEMDSEKAHLQTGGEAGESPQQRGGVGAAREGGDDAVPRSDGGCRAEEALQRMEKVHEVGLEARTMVAVTGLEPMT